MYSYGKRGQMYFHRILLCISMGFSSESVWLWVISEKISMAYLYEYRGELQIFVSATFFSVYSIPIYYWPKHFVMTQIWHISYWFWKSLFLIQSDKCHKTFINIDSRVLTQQHEYYNVNSIVTSNTFWKDILSVLLLHRFWYLLRISTTEGKTISGILIPKLNKDRF